MNTSSNPYIGPRTFTEDERDRFYGREREADELLGRVLSEQEVVFYAQSGAGKSSLVNTCLIPELREEGIEVLLGRVGGDAPAGLEVDNVFVFNLLRSLSTSEVNADTLSKQSLSEFLVLNPDGRGSKRRALIIDQFEEIFSTHDEAWEKRADFFKQLARALKADPRLRVVFVMREDFIASIDPYARLLPGRFQVRYYMQRLEYGAALKAVKEPVKSGDFSRPYEAGVAEKLVDDLRSVKVYKSGGTEALEPGQYVEPVQLQVVCYNLWENLPEGGTHIREQDLQDVGNVSASLGKYYETRVKAVAEAKQVNERKIREWFTDKLISPTGIRNMVLQERGGKSGGLENDVIQALPDLVRAETRGGATFYELTHDRLVEPIIENNTQWDLINSSPFRSLAEEWVKSAEDKKQDHLLSDQALIAAGQWATEHPNELTDAEREFLEECRIKQMEREKERERQAQQQKLETTQRRLELTQKLADEQARSAQRARRFNLIASALVIMALIATGFAITSSRRALTTAEELAIEKDEANAARDEAKEQADTALSGQLSAYALDKSSSQPDLAILLSLEADRIHSDIHTRNALLTSLQETANIQSFLDQTVQAEEAQFSPDGKLLALRNKDGITIWDAESMRPLTTSINGHFSEVTALTLSKDGKIMASASCVDVDCVKSEIVLWDAQTGKPLGEALTGQKAAVYSVAFSPDGKILASGSYDNTIILWDISNPLDPFKIAILTEHTDLIESVAFSPDGKILASASDDQTVRLWDAHTGKQIMEPLSGHTSSVNFVTFSPDGKILASSGGDGIIILWNVATGKAIAAPLREHSATVWYMAFSRDGKILASGGEDEKVILWDVAKRQPIDEPLTGHGNTVWSVAFSPDSKILASSGDDGRIILWDVAKRQPIGKPLTQHKDAIYSLAFSPAGDMLVSGSLDSTIIYWDVTKPATVRMIGEPLKGHLGQPTNMQFSSDGLLLASEGNDRTILLNIASETPIGTPIGDGDLVTTNSNDDIVAYQTYQRSSYGDIETSIHIRDAATGNDIAEPIPGENPIFSPNGKILVYQTIDQNTDQTQLHLWDVTAKKNLSSVIVGESPTFSPDSQILMYLTDQQEVINLWNIAEAKSIGQPIPGTFLAINPDHNVLVYGMPDPESDNLFIKQWSIIDEKELDEVTPRTFLGVSQNGEVLAFQTLDDDGLESINLLDLATGVVSNNLVESGYFLVLNEDGRILFYSSSDDQGGEYVHAFDTESRTPIGEPITGALAFKSDTSDYAIWQVGKVLAYETEVYNDAVQENQSSIAFINTSTYAPIGDVIFNGSYLGQARDGEILVYQTVENKKPMINLMDTATGLPTNEPIQGKFLGIRPDGKTVVFRNESDSIVFWDTTKTWPLGAPVTESPENVTDAALSLDGNTLAWVGEDGIALYNAVKGTMIGEPFFSHYGVVTSVYFRPDDKTLIARGEDGNVVIWNFTTQLQDGETIHLGENSDIQLTKDGNILVVSDDNNSSIILWNLDTQKQIGDVISGSSAVLSPDGTMLAVGNDSNNTTTLWNLATYQQSGKAIPGLYATFSADSNLLAVGDYDNNQTTFWNLDPFEEIGQEIPGYYVTFSSDGLIFANYETNDTTTLWSLSSYTKLGKPFLGFGRFSPNGKLLAIRSFEDNKTTLWDISVPDNPSQLVTEPLTGSYPEFNSSGNLLAVYDSDSDPDKNLVSIFDLANPDPKRINPRPVSESDFAFSPTGDIVAYVDGKGIVIWDRNSQPSSGNSLKIYPGLISGMAFNKDGAVLAVYGNSGIVLWDINNKKELGETLPGSIVPGTGITLSPNGRILVSQANDGLVLRNLDANKDIHLETGEYAGQLTSNMSFYANGTRFVAIGEDGTLLSWDISGGEPVIVDDEKQPLKGKSNTLAVFSPDGRYMAYDSYGRIRIWDIQESHPYMEVGDFPEAENSIGAITFSSEGRLLAYTDGPKILLWDILQKEKLGELLTGSNSITGLSLMMNNAIPQYLVSEDDSGVTQIWDWATRTKIGTPMSGDLQIVGFNNPSRTVYYIEPTGRLIQWQWGLTVEAWKQILCPLVRRNFSKEEWNLYFPNEEYPSTKELLTCPDYPAG